jgi:hypothetical protein
MSLVGGFLLPFAGVPWGGTLVGVITLILGGLIYRDIIRREQRAS